MFFTLVISFFCYSERALKLMVTKQNQVLVIALETTQIQNPVIQKYLVQNATNFAMLSMRKAVEYMPGIIGAPHFLSTWETTARLPVVKGVK